VNNDTYDDFVISAHRSDESEPDAGQAYLVLGSESGWSQDTDLSNADASFIGSATEDFAGVDVTGIGDVNNDSYEDFLIGLMGWTAARVLRISARLI